jgi:hypothetical protein
MNRSVVTNYRTAWCRSHRATSGFTAGSKRLGQSGRGEKRATGTAWAFLIAPLLQFQPDQEAVCQHHRDGMPVVARPQSTLIQVPPHLSYCPVMKQFHNRKWFRSWGRRRLAAADLFQEMAGLPSPEG